MIEGADLGGGASQAKCGDRSRDIFRTAATPAQRSRCASHRITACGSAARRLENICRFFKGHTSSTPPETPLPPLHSAFAFRPPNASRGHPAHPPQTGDHHKTDWRSALAASHAWLVYCTLRVRYSNSTVSNTSASSLRRCMPACEVSSD